MFWQGCPQFTASASLPTFSAFDFRQRRGCVVGHDAIAQKHATANFLAVALYST